MTNEPTPMDELRENEEKRRAQRKAEDLEMKAEDLEHQLPYLRFIATIAIYLKTGDDVKSCRQRADTFIEYLKKDILG